MLKFNDNFNEWFNEFKGKAASVKTCFPAQHEQKIYIYIHSTTAQNTINILQEINNTITKKYIITNDNATIKVTNIQPFI